MRFVPRLGDDTPQLDEDALADALGDFPLQLGVLFGSQAGGSPNVLSDLDVAVLFEDGVPAADKRHYVLEIAGAITTATGFEAVDVVDIAEASSRIGSAALADGHLIIGSEATATEWETKLLLEKLDFQPIVDEWQAALDRRIERGTYGRSR